MTSLMENNKDLDEINFFILNDQICKENTERLKQCCDNYGRSITVIETDAVLARLRDECRVAPFKGTYTTYFKLISIKDLSIPTDRILQLDGDTIINGSLAPLCDMDLDGYIMAATYDCLMNDYKALIGVPLTDKFYNGGVLLINQPEWIRENCEERIVHHLKSERAGYYTVDQDILNVLFRDKIKYLDITYNFNAGFYLYGINESFKIYDLKPEYYNTYEEVAAAYDDPVINHCMGAMTGRPWEASNVHPQNELYDRYLAISPWRDCEKVKVNRDVVFRIQRLLYKTMPRGVYARFHRYGLKRFLNNMNETVQEQR